MFELQLTEYLFFNTNQLFIRAQKSTTYQISIVLQSPKTPSSEPCSNRGGKRLPLTKDGDGNEEYCMCKSGFLGDICEDKIKRITSNIMDMSELDEWKKNLKVPGMFDLMDAIEKSAEEITNHVTEVHLFLTLLK